MTDLHDSLLSAQVGVLGSLLIDPEHTAGEIMQAVRPEDFTTAQYRVIFEACRKIFTAGTPVDPIVVAETIGGDRDTIIPLMMQIMEVTPTAASFRYYIEALKKTSLLQRLRNIGLTLGGAEDVGACQTALAEAEQLLAGRSGVAAVSMSAALSDFYDRHGEHGEPDFLRWGMDELDDAIHAFPGSMVVIGGYPSDGKTSLAARFAAHMAQEKRVGFFSYETSAPALFDRIASMVTAIPLPQMQKNSITSEGWDTMAVLSGKIGRLHLEILEAGGMTVAQLRALALARRYEVVFIDYLQKITPAQTSRWQSSFEAVSQISNDLQQFGRQTGVSVVALSQLSRPERNKGQTPPPSLSSLRQSGQIEQDADVVLLLYREEPDQQDSRMILKVAKNKDGRANVGFFLDFDGETQTFRKSRSQEPKIKPKNGTKTPKLPTFRPTDEPIPQEVMDGWNEGKALPF